MDMWAMLGRVAAYLWLVKQRGFEHVPRCSRHMSYITDRKPRATNCTFLKAGAPIAIRSVE
jgi:hypothetical protein